MIFRFHLNQLRRQLEALKQRDYSWDEIGEGAGVHPNTIYPLSASQVLRVDLSTLAKLIEYFKKQGLTVTLNDFMSLEEGDYDEERVKWEEEKQAKRARREKRKKKQETA